MIELSARALQVNHFRWLALAFAAGAFAQLQHALQPVLWPVAVYLGLFALGFILFIAIVVIAVKSIGMLSTHKIMCVFAGLLVGFSSAGLHGVASFAPLAPELEGQELVLTGVVASLPVASLDSLRFEFDVDSPAPGIPPRVQLAWYAPANPAVIKPGTRWLFTVKLRAAHGVLNLHGFDGELQLLERGVQALGYVRPKGERQLLSTEVPWNYQVDALRYRLKERIRAALGDAPFTGVVQALAMGDQSAIERSDWAVYRDSGIGHLMSISGLHVTMFAWLAGVCVSFAWRRSSRLMHWLPAPTAARGLGLVCAFLYSLVAGFGVPAARTVLMLAVATWASLSGRRFAWIDVLLAALVVVVALDPWALLAAGFWLSFSAVALLFWSSYKASAEQSVKESRFINNSELKTALRSQAVATVALVPLTVLFFGQVSLVSPLANAVAIPLVSLVVTPLAVVGMLLPAPLSTLLWSTAHALLAGLQWGLSWLVTLPAATVALPAPNLTVMLFAMAGVALLVAPAIGALRWLGALLMLPLVMLRPLPVPEGEFAVQFLDVGQGTSVLIQTHTGALLFDTGASYPGGADAGERVVVPMLRALGVRTLDVLMISHADSDHAGGAQSVLAAFPVKRLLTSITGAATALVLHPRGPVLESCTRGQRWEQSGVRFAVLNPTDEDYSRPLKTNPMSCVLSVTSASGKRLIVTGDAEAPQEAAMVAADRQALKADVLVIGHHGSKTSTSPVFLEAVQPRYAVTQVAYRSRYGHPHPTVVERLAQAGVPSLRSDCDGGLAWRSDAPDVWVKARVERARYWRHTGSGIQARTHAGKPSSACAKFDTETARGIGTKLADPPSNLTSPPAAFTAPDFQEEE